MLKLTRCLFCQEPRAAYADYYERTLLNHILSSQHPQTGAMLYFEELESGRPKAARWSDPNRPLPCCHGTGLESHAKYADSIYFHDGRDGLFVNLFIASVLEWKDKGLTLRQETRYPDEPSTRLLFTCEKPLTLTVNLRRPWWATSGFQVLVNGERQEIRQHAGQLRPGETNLAKRRYAGSGDAHDVPHGRVRRQSPAGSRYVRAARDGGTDGGGKPFLGHPGGGRPILDEPQAGSRQAVGIHCPCDDLPHLSPVARKRTGLLPSAACG